MPCLFGSWNNWIIGKNVMHFKKILSHAHVYIDTLYTLSIKLKKLENCVAIYGYLTREGTITQTWWTDLHQLATKTINFLWFIN